MGAGMTEKSEAVTLTTEQFDEALRTWKRKGTERAFTFVFVASVPLAFLGGVFLAEANPLHVVIACATYYCGVAALAYFTQ